MSFRSPSPCLGLSYTIRFKNGQVLRHQGPLALAQFQSDIRLAGFVLESAVASLGTSSRLTEPC